MLQFARLDDDKNKRVKITNQMHCIITFYDTWGGTLFSRHFYHGKQNYNLHLRTFLDGIPFKIVSKLFKSRYLLETKATKKNGKVPYP